MNYFKEVNKLSKQDKKAWLTFIAFSGIVAYILTVTTGLLLVSKGATALQAHGTQAMIFIVLSSIFKVIRTKYGTKKVYTAWITIFDIAIMISVISTLIALIS